MGGGADLADGARRTFQRIAVHRLDRIDDDQSRRRTGVKSGENVPNRGRGGERDRSLCHAEAAGAKADLIGGFLARDIRDADPAQRHSPGGLKEQRRLANARVAADQHRRPGDEPAAECAVEFGDAGRRPRGNRNIVVETGQPDAAPTAAKRVLGAERGDDRRRLLLDRIPCAAIAALSRPARGHRTARLADISGSGAGHRSSEYEA